MNDKHNPKLKGISKVLRKNMTKEEKHLWYDFLKKLPITVNRQKVIGKYVVDFYCAKAKLVIELDGSQHGTDKGIMIDEERDKFLENLGITVLRYSNYDVNKYFNSVCDGIEEFIKEKVEGYSVYRSIVD